LCIAYAYCANKVKRFVQQRAYQNYLLDDTGVEEMKHISKVYLPNKKKQSTSSPIPCIRALLAQS